MLKLFLKIMLRNKTIKLTSESGKKYKITYHRETFWTNEIPSFKLFFKEKIYKWHGQVWLIGDYGNLTGFGHYCCFKYFPRKFMKSCLKKEVNRLEKIFSKY